MNLITAKELLSLKAKAIKTIIKDNKLSYAIVDFESTNLKKHDFNTLLVDKNKEYARLYMQAIVIIRYHIVYYQLENIDSLYSVEELRLIEVEIIEKLKNILKKIGVSCFIDESFPFFYQGCSNKEIDEALSKIDKKFYLAHGINVDYVIDNLVRCEDYIEKKENENKELIKLTRKK